jgi:hypothetical protein
MLHWPTTLNTIVGLVLGGGLTMAGQVLADRRARRREREARRETFLIQNFTAQREALMKIQEMVEEFGNKLNDECFERTGNRYFAFVATPEGQEGFEKLYLFYSGSSSDEQQYSEDLGRFAQHFNHFKDEYNRSLRLSADGANKEAHSLKERRAFKTELTILANRTGSELIATEARRYIETADGFADERSEFTSEFVARIRLQAAITKALTEGPLAA